MRKWFSGIRAQLLLIGTIALIALMVVGSSGYIAISNLADKLDVAYNQRLWLSEELGAIDAGIHASFRYQWIAFSDDRPEEANEKKKFIQKAYDEIDGVTAAIKRYSEIPKSKEAQDLVLTTLIPKWEESSKLMKQVLVELSKNESQSNDRAELMIKTKQRDSTKPVKEAVDWLQERALKTNKRIVNESLVYADTAKKKAIGIVVLSAVFCFIVSVFIAMQLVRKLSILSTDLNSSSIQVSAAAEQIASTSEQLSQASSEQAASVEETSSSIQEMSTMVSKTSENAIQASKISIESQSNALKGKEVIHDMMKSINEISDSNKSIMYQVEKSNNEISDIVLVIGEIANKTKVINDIVFQTKLLSFNASVEAARAGENGKGFAVVAEEVGNLAQMSGRAASEITEMLTSSIKKVEATVNNTKSSVGRLIDEGRVKVEKGSSIAEECGKVLEQIVESISIVKDMANEIAESSKEQSQGVGEVTRAISQINIATQQNAAGATQSASAAEELSAQANMLKNAVQSLVITIDGQKK